VATVLQSIHVYPVKSLRGCTLAQSDVEPWGLKHDRRWVVLRPDGSRLSAREDRRMLGLGAVALEADGVRLIAPDGSTIDVGAPVDGEFTATSISRLGVVRLAEPAVHDWLSAQLSSSVRLGWLDDPGRRPVSQAHGGRVGEPLSLADAGPLLLTSVTSLRQLNEWMGQSPEHPEQPPPPVVMARFRPNVVVEGIDNPFAEDGWTRVQIGEVRLRQAERCDRCMMTLIDPDTLAQGKEPLRSLAQHRRRDGKVWFGIRLIPESIGRIGVGDPVIRLG
jgi:MOSC domain-containing protein